MRTRAGTHRAVATIIVLAFAAATSAAPQARGVDPGEAAIRQLRKATSPQRDNSHLPALMALRQMRDPELEGYFRRLLQVPDWQVQVHAVLGLAELSELDPWLVTRIDPRGQQHVIAHALDEEMLTPERVSRLLELQELEPMPRLLLVGENVLEDRPVDLDTLRRLSDSGNLQVAALASCLLAQVDDQASLSPYRERLAALSRRDREQHLTWVFDAIRQYELDRCIPIVVEALDDDRPSRSVISSGVLTCLHLDPPTGIAMWQRFFGRATTQSAKVRFALLLAASADQVGSKTFELLPKGDPLIDALAESGRRLADGTDPVPSFCKLVDLNNIRTTDWAMSRCRKFTDTQAAAVYEHMIDSIDTGMPPGRVAASVKASSLLFEANPDAIISRMRTAENGSLRQQVLMLGLYETTSPRVVEAVRDVPRIGPRRADSMALILLARHNAPLNDDDMRQLGTIAAGGGRVSDMLQIQAAWQYVKRSAGGETSLAQVFSDS